MIPVGHMCDKLFLEYITDKKRQNTVLIVNVDKHVYCNSPLLKSLILSATHKEDTQTTSRCC